MYQHLRVVVRLAFLAGSAGVLFVALYPNHFDPAPMGNDKAQHFFAFLVISGLGRLGWPTAGWGIALALVIVGGGIELLQGMPFIDRDMNFLDWLADSVGVLAGILGADAAMRIATACGIATMLRAFGASAPTSGGLMR